MKTRVGRLFRIFEAASEGGTAREAMALAEDVGVSGLFTRLAGDRDASAPGGQYLVRRIYQEELLRVRGELSAHLASEGIAHLFVKGGALLGDTYEPGDVELADLDLHVRPDSVARAVHVLSGIGFDNTTPSDGPLSLDPRTTMTRASPDAEAFSFDLDVHDGVIPVSRLLTVTSTRLPEAVWEAADASVPRPAPGHHAALLVHHLVHHDFLSFRNAVDLALIWDAVLDDQDRLGELAGQLHVLRAARAVTHTLSVGLDLPPLTGLGAAGGGWRDAALSRVLDLVHWLRWCGEADTADFEGITWRRFRRRLVAVDRTRQWTSLIRDALIPPPAYLRLRWPQAKGWAGAYARHLSRLTGRALDRL